MFCNGISGCHGGNIEAEQIEILIFRPRKLDIAEQNILNREHMFSSDGSDS